MSLYNYDDNYQRILSRFNPHRVNSDAQEIMIKGIPYVFMTCPMLNLTKENIAASDFLGFLASHKKGTQNDPGGSENYDILRYLSGGDTLYGEYSKPDISSPNTWVPLITNTAISIDIKDTAARTKEVGETFYGYKQVYPGSTVDSIVGDEISIKYLEYSTLPVIKFHKAWLEYIEGVRRGIFIPSESALENGYIDFLVSIYYFLTDFSGEKIIYWAKYTGCGPLIIPYSSLGGDFNSHDIPDITINYSYCHKADMDFAILRDFNKVSTKKASIAEFNYKNISNGKETFDASYIANDGVVGDKSSDKHKEYLKELKKYNYDLYSFGIDYYCAEPKVVIRKNEKGEKYPYLEWDLGNET